MRTRADGAASNHAHVKTASGIRHGAVPRAVRGRDNAGMTSSTLRIDFNGEPREFPAPLDIPGLLANEGLGERRVAVEVNGEIVPRSRHAGFELADGDRVEVVHALGGG